MIISHKHRFIFLKPQKCAGTSVELALSGLCGPDDVITHWGPEERELVQQLGVEPRNVSLPLQYRRPTWKLREGLGFRDARVGSVYYEHMPAPEVRRRMDPALFDAYRKVTISRNPWDREVSRYFWRYRDQENPPSFDRYVMWPRYRPARKTFDLYSINGTMIADTVIRYENLKEDFASFVKTLGVDTCPELPRAKGNYRPQARRDYHDFYSPLSRRIVARRYAREIDSFGYQF